MSTQAYVDLMFAWGHARLGDTDAAHNLLSAAADQLRPLADGSHDWLLKAFTYRIEQASRGEPHDGPWPPNFVAALREAENLPRFGADRFRATSRILEPVERADPYAPWKKGSSGPEWYRRPTTEPGPPREWLEEKFADLVQLADHASTGAGLGSLVHPQGTNRFVTALEAAGRAGLAEAVNARLADLHRLVGGEKPVSGSKVYLLLTLSAALRRLGRRAEGATLADQHRAAELAEYNRAHDPARLAASLSLAALDLWLGRMESAAPVLDLARQSVPQLEPERLRLRMIRDYLEAIAWAPWPNSLAHLFALLNVLPHFLNNSTTSSWYSISHLEIADGVVLALATYDFGPAEAMLRSMPRAELASRREALVEVRGKLVEWGQKGWGPSKSS